MRTSVSDHVTAALDGLLSALILAVVGLGVVPAVLAGVVVYALLVVLFAVHRGHRPAARAAVSCLADDAAQRLPTGLTTA